MKTEVYLLDITSYSDEFVKAEYEKVSSHFISIDGEKLSQRKESLLGKLLLCRTLADRGVGEFQVQYKAGQKPRLTCDEPLRFNISHSGKFAVVALSGSEVGCDIQEIRPYNPKVTKRNYCEEEIALIENSDDKDDIFIRLWALKESILKFTGEGISGGLSSYDFSAYVHYESFTAFGCNFYVKKTEDVYLAVCHKGETVRIIKAQL